MGLLDTSRRFSFHKPLNQSDHFYFRLNLRNLRGGKLIRSAPIDQPNHL